MGMKVFRCSLILLTIRSMTPMNGFSFGRDGGLLR
jgi:hypothetical protein